MFPKCVVCWKYCFCNCLNYFVIFNKYVVKYVFIFWHWCCFVRDRSVVWKHMSIVFFPMFEKVLLLVHYNHVSLVDLVCESMSIFYCKSIYYWFTIWLFIMTSSVMLTLSYDMTSYCSLLTMFIISMKLGSHDFFFVFFYMN